MICVAGCIVIGCMICVADCIVMWCTGSLCYGIYILI